uniref:Putative secreted protein n=1 Tax=Anopheles darlingi TaxID=43151 RepID=A0A2M4D6K9_ANODA
MFSFLFLSCSAFALGISLLLAFPALVSPEGVLCHIVIGVQAERQYITIHNELIEPRKVALLFRTFPVACISYRHSRPPVNGRSSRSLRESEGWGRTIRT